MKQDKTDWLINCIKEKYYESYKSYDFDTSNFLLTLIVETGGVQGGSCWDNSDPRPYSTDVNADDNKVLDLYLNEFYPNTTFLKYETIPVKFENYTESEYYGNCTHFEKYTIDLNELDQHIDGR